MKLSSELSSVFFGLCNQCENCAPATFASRPFFICTACSLPRTLWIIKCVSRKQKKKRLWEKGVEFSQHEQQNMAKWPDSQKQQQLHHHTIKGLTSMPQYERSQHHHSAAVHFLLSLPLKQGSGEDIKSDGGLILTLGSSTERKPNLKTYYAPQKGFVSFSQSILCSWKRLVERLIITWQPLFTAWRGIKLCWVLFSADTPSWYTSSAVCGHAGRFHPLKEGKQRGKFGRDGKSSDLDLICLANDDECPPET